MGEGTAEAGLRMPPVSLLVDSACIFLTSPCAALGFGGLAHFLPSHNGRCLTNHQSVASLAIALGKSLECPASQLVGFSVYGGWAGGVAGRDSILSNMTEAPA